MEDKKAYEAFRVRQFASPHPALEHIQAAGERPAQNATDAARPDPADVPGAAVLDPLHANLAPDHERVILHFDVDCFYSQVEECRNPALRGKPLAVTQKYLVVTANYPARAAGVTKLMGIADAKKACPQLILVPGEDLTPYRAASRDIRAVLSRWGPTEKLGLDESWVDVTQEVNRRVSAATQAGLSNILTAPWCGHLVKTGLQLTAHSRHRPMDLRVVMEDQQHGAQLQAKVQAQALPEAAQQQVFEQVNPSAGAAAGGQAERQQPPAAGVGTYGAEGASSGAAAATAPLDVQAGSPTQPAWVAGAELRLNLGAVIAAEMRQAVQQEAGYRCSAGIACSKLLSKLVSGLHKPDDQTTILPTEAQGFVAPLPVRALPGVGYKAEGLLKSWGVVTAADARSISKPQLVKGLGDKHGTSLFYACRGVDPSPVIPSGPPKSITVEDSFKSCCSWQGLATVLQVLVPDLLDRLREDAQEFPELRRAPATLTVKWRKAGTGWARSSASTAWPAAARPTAGRRAAAAAAAASGGGVADDDNEAEQVAVLTAAATSVLKQHLPPSGWSLTLLNIGATGFKARLGPGAAGGIQQFLLPKQPAPSTGGSSTSDTGTGSAAVMQGTAGSTVAALPSISAAVSATTALQTALPPMPHACQNLLQTARAATEARRDYSRSSSTTGSHCGGPWSASLSSPQHGRTSPQQAAASTHKPGVVLSKRQERRLWELAMQQPQQQGLMMTPLADDADTQPPSSDLQQPQQQRMQPAQLDLQPQQHGPCDPPHRGRAGRDGPQLSRLQQQCGLADGPTCIYGKEVLPTSPDAAADTTACAVVVEPPAKRPCLQDPCSNMTTSRADIHSLPDLHVPAAASVGHDGDTTGAAVDPLGGADMSCCCTNLHSIDGWGLIACEVLEDCGEGSDVL